MGKINFCYRGLLILPKNSSFSLLSGPPKDEIPPGGCLLTNRPAVYKPPRHGAWLDPSNWIPIDQDSAKPHTHQVPCHHDSVVFPTDMAYKMSATDADIEVSKLLMNGKSFDSGGLRSVFKSDVGRKMFNVTKDIRVTGRQCMVS